uniref:ISAon1 family transposase N-terminal region protein n=1 Tax=Phocaeicola vulgatus TaxID=821 RepID=UPI0040258C4D
MSRLQTLRMIACMLLMGVVAIAAYLFYQHSLYFCLFFSLMIMAGIIIYICQWQYKTTRMISRMIEGIRYADFSLSFSTQHKTRTEQRLAQEINNVVAEFRTRLSENEERYQYYETLLNTVDSSLLVVDSQCNIHWMNRAAMQDLCGYRIHSVRELALLNSDFPTIILSLQPGEIKTVRIHKGDIIQELAVTVSEYSAQHGTELRLVNLKNIHAVLEENEMEAWQKLIRVLTHEIMNSIAPIISLSETLSERAVQNGMNERDYGSPDKSGGKFFNSIENLHLCTMNNQGLLALAQLILPSEILSNFEVVRVEEEASLIRIYLDESVKAEYKENPEIESKGFCEAVTIRDFPIRDKGV